MVENILFSIFSHDYSGLLVGVGLLAIAVALSRTGRGASRWIGWSLGLVAFVLTAGAGSHLVRLANLKKRLPPPGDMVDVGGYRMHVLADGPESGPAIVWFGGGHAGGLAFIKQHDAVKDSFRSILVDRPGAGWSDVGPFPRTTAREADEVMRALRAAGEKGPFIFAGHSFGGLLAANIARRYPNETAAIVLIDATPLDIIFYGADKKGLGALEKMEREQGWREVFGFYGEPKHDEAPWAAGEATTDYPDPTYTLRLLATQAGQRFAGASIYKELTPKGLAERAWDTFIADGELGDMPLYLIAPMGDPVLQPYAESVLGPGKDADRFVKFLLDARERYLRASSHSTRIVAPANTSHNFVYEDPAFMTKTIRDIHDQIARALDEKKKRYSSLTTQWPGAFGGLPPVGAATPERIEAAYRRAIVEKRAAILAIAENSAGPTFENTIEALETSGVALDRVKALLEIITSSASDAEVAAVAARLATLKPAVDSEMSSNTKLFARVKAVYEGLPDSAPTSEARRLTTVTYNAMVRAGADLSAEKQTRLSEINKRLAELITQFGANIRSDEANLFVYVEHEKRLSGIPDEMSRAAKAAAETNGRPGVWAFRITRNIVWPILTNADSRSLREEVWRAWARHGGNQGENDNSPVMSEILKLRGEKAKLFGYPTFAHYQTASRMIGTPEAALALLDRTWKAVLPPTLDNLSQMQTIADEEGAGGRLEPWDELYYAEKLRKRQFNFDSSAVTPYLELDKIVDAMFWAAGATYGFSFHKISDAPVVSDDVKVYEVRRHGETAGVLYVDLFERSGKAPSSWSTQVRAAADYNEKVLPIAALYSSVQKPADGGPVLVPWERANVIFHEFGHTLHTLATTVSYPSLGNLAMPWDFIEVPSLFNEQWLQSDEVISRFLVHNKTGEPMPPNLIASLKASLKHDRVFSLNTSYLAPAIVDMRLHLMTDGREIDAIAEESSVLRELNMPPVVLTLYAPNAFHTFSREYAAGLYTYLWSEMIAADIGEAFRSTPNGLYDKDVASKYYADLLSVGFTKPTDEAFRTFRGRDPDPDALLRRFDLISVK